LTHWQADPDLAGLRDASALEHLSSAERMDCRMLWNEVGSLLSRARTAQ
jgi:hypothetical protein